MTPQHCMDQLRSIRSSAGPAFTRGLGDEVIRKFLVIDKDLPKAVSAAAANRRKLAPAYEKLFKMEEKALCRLLQGAVLNFYSAPSINLAVCINSMRTCPQSGIITSSSMIKQPLSILSIGSDISKYTTQICLSICLKPE